MLEFGRLAAEFGLRYFEMQRDWARWAMEQLDQEYAATGWDRQPGSSAE